MRRVDLTSVLLLLLVAPLFGQQPPNPQPIHYDRQRVVHHFYLYPDGGMMTLAVTDPSDAETRKVVRAYVQRVSQLMVVGNLERMREQFGESVPGLDRIAEARGRKATITVRSSAPDEGSHIIFSTADPEVLQGLHEFLRFQINDLKTGDSLEVRERENSGLKGGTAAVEKTRDFTPSRAVGRDRDSRRNRPASRTRTERGSWAPARERVGESERASRPRCGGRIVGMESRP